MMRTSWVLLTVACGGAAETADDDDLTLTLSEEIPTVVTLSWLPGRDDLDQAWVSYGPDGDLGSTVALDLTDGEPYTTVIFGLRAHQEYHFEVAAAAGDETVASAEHAVVTGDVPVSLPELTVATGDDGFAETGFMVTSVVAAPPAPVVIDQDGNYVWWLVPDDSDEIGRASLSRDGGSILWWEINLRGSGGGGTAPGESSTQVLHRTSLDGTVQETIEMGEGHHDFVELEDGTIAYVEYDVRDVDGQEVEGDRIVERDPKGATTVVWSAWDDFEYDGVQRPGQTWTHMNAIDWVPEEDAYYVSSLGLGTILSIDRATGTLNWVMGGDESDFSLQGSDEAPFEGQHQMQRLADSLLVFDNGSEERRASRAVEYAMSDGTISEAWSYAAETDVNVFSLGDVQRLASGHTVVTFSMAGQVDFVEDSGALARRLQAGLGGALGYLTWLDWPPAED